jgi:hypothetical protein
MAIGCKHERAGKTEMFKTNEKCIDISVTAHSRLGRINQDRVHTARIQVNILLTVITNHKCDSDFS